MPATEAGGITLEYEVHGASGEHLLLIQGLGYARWGWEPVVAPLAESFRVVTFDNRGIGGSEKPPGPYTVEAMAADAAGLLEALGIEGSHVAGTSGGGFIAMELATSRPDLVDRLVIACSPLPGPFGDWMPEVTIRLLAEAAGIEDEETRLRRFIVNALSEGFVRDHPEAVDRILGHRLATAQPVAAWDAQRAAFFAYQDPLRVSRVDAPTLVTSGTDDRVVSHESARKLAESVPGAAFVPFEGAGHLHFWEQPDRFAEVVTEFLRGGEAARA